MTLPGRRQLDAVLLLFENPGLPRGIALKDGEIVEGTSKHGIGFRAAGNALLDAAKSGYLVDGSVGGFQSGLFVNGGDDHLSRMF